jgi:hypothetical protein
MRKPRYQRSISAILPFLLLAGCELGPCPDNSSPAEGTCTCADGTPIEASECDACEGSEPVDFGVVGGAEQRGSIIAACERRFTFSVSSLVTLQLLVSEANQSIALALQTSSGVVLGSANASAGADAPLTRNLGPGTYQVVLRSSSGQASPFQLELQAGEYGSEGDPEPGENQDEAAPLGELGTLVTQPGYVGATDTADFYAFSVTEIGTLTYALANTHGAVRGDLYEHTTIFDPNKPIATLDVPPSSMGDTVEFALERGDYLIRVTTTGGDTLYDLQLSGARYDDALDEEAPEPSEDWMEATDIGTVGEHRLDRVGYVGKTDPADYYRFELASNARLIYSLSNVVGSVKADFYTGDEQIDPDRPIGSLTSDTDGEKGELVLTGGRGEFYLVRITPTDARYGSLYTLSMNVE